MPKQRAGISQDQMMPLADLDFGAEAMNVNLSCLFGQRRTSTMFARLKHHHISDKTELSEVIGKS